MSKDPFRREQFGDPNYIAGWRDALDEVLALPISADVRARVHVLKERNEVWGLDRCRCGAARPEKHCPHCEAPLGWGVTRCWNGCGRELSISFRCESCGRG